MHDCGWENTNDTSLQVLIPHILFGSRLFAQTTIREQLAQASSSLREDNSEQAIAIARSLIDKNSLTKTDLAKTWNVLGLAYAQQENLTAARHAYEEAIQLLRSNGTDASNYAEALSNFGDLYRNIGQFATATTLQIKALHLYEGIGDHVGIARTCSDLAGIELSQKHNRNGKKYLERSSSELNSLSHWNNDDDRAIIYELRGWSAELDGNAWAALSEYQHALRLRENLHGDNNSNSGWGHVLLGKVYSELGDTENAKDHFGRGLLILREAYGAQSIQYLRVEIAYSRFLDQIGAHAEAAQLRSMAQDKIRQQHQDQCADCLISADAFR